MKKLMSLLIAGAIVVLTGCDPKCTSDCPLPPPPTLDTTGIAGYWHGITRDSSGMGNARFHFYQNGTAVSGNGTVCTPGGKCITINSISATKTGENVSGSMSGTYASCSISLDFSITANSNIRGTYTGTNSCSGPFTNGSFSLNKESVVTGVPSAYLYETRDIPNTSSSFITTANTEGGTGFRLLTINSFLGIAYSFSDGVKSIYIKDTANSGTFTYKALPPASSSSGFITQANSQGSLGYHYLGTYMFGDGNFAIYERSSAVPTPVSYTDSSSLSVEDLTIVKDNKFFSFIGSFSFSDGPKSIYVSNDAEHSGAGATSIDINSSSSVDFINNVNFNGLSGKRFYGSYLIDGEGYLIYFSDSHSYSYTTSAVDSESSVDFLNTSTSFGANGYKFVGNFVFSNGTKAVYEKRL